MRRNDALYRLVKSMSRSEKRYFKIVTAQGGKEKKYLMLFDAIAGQDEYDEEELKRRFRNEKFVRQFSVAKNYLYRLVMKSLRQFHAEETVESRLQVITLYEGRYNGEKRSIPCDVRGLETGTYFCVVEIGGKRFYRMLAVHK